VFQNLKRARIVLLGVVVNPGWPMPTDATPRQWFRHSSASWLSKAKLFSHTCLVRPNGTSKPPCLIC